MTEPAPVVRLQRSFRASAEDVFAAWLHPASLERWMFGRAGSDERVVHLELEARVGGQFSFLVQRQGHDFDHVGEYLELVAPRRLAFTWDVGKRRAEGSHVEIDLVETDGGVSLSLVHTLPLEAAPYANQTRAGWMRMLGALAQVVELEPTAPPP